jgi:hypothetical protein
MSINASSIELLDQLKSVISDLSNELFSVPISTLSNSSIGQHTRHTLEFFICMMDAKNEGIINYDKRKHDKFIEEDKNLALSIIGSIQDFLFKNQSNFPLLMHANYALEESAEEQIETNFFRELAYNIEHTIHHMALIKIGIKEIAPNIKLPEHFGVASSTVRYQAQHS